MYRKEICQTRESKTVEIILKTPVVMSAIRLCYKWVGLAHAFDTCHTFDSSISDLTLELLWKVEGLFE